MDEIETLESNDDFSFFVPFLEVKKANRVMEYVEDYLAGNGYRNGYYFYLSCSEIKRYGSYFTKFTFSGKKFKPELKEMIKTSLIQAIAIRR